MNYSIVQNVSDTELFQYVRQDELSTPRRRVTSDRIPGDIMEYCGRDYIIRSIDFESGTAVLERLQSWPVIFITVPVDIGVADLDARCPRQTIAKASFDLRMFRSVLQRNIDYVAPRVVKTGRFKLSKKLLTRLMKQLRAVVSCA